MKTDHYKTALKALKKQREVFENDRDKYEVAEKSARESKEFCEAELMDIEKQIAETQRKVDQSEGKQKELQLT